VNARAARALTGPLTLALAAVVATVACREASSPGRPVIRVGYSTLPDFGDLPSVIAHTELTRQGFDIQVVYFALSEIGAEALARGEVDVASGSTRAYWSAAARGAPVRAVMEHVANEHRLVTTNGVQHCRELAGLRVGLQSEGGAGTALWRAFVAEACPGLDAQILLIPHSESRAAALLSNKLHAAVVEQAVVAWLEERAPGRFQVLENFAARWPGIKTSAVFVNDAFAAAHPDRVHAYVRARLDVHRRAAADPAVIGEEAARQFGPSADLSLTVARYHADRAWAADGGMAPADVEHTLRFLTEFSGFPPGFTTDRAADLRFLMGARGGGAHP
jgi:ABC-type nitrate/sulfonate/bicarbonate transport system substrate-binding protein